jgi:hypothetical protein
MRWILSRSRAKRSLFGVTILGIALTLAVLPARSQTASPHCGGSSTVADYDPDLVPRASAFLASLQQATRNGDRTAIAKMVHYPLRINGLKSRKWIRTPAQFEAQYASLFT